MAGLSVPVIQDSAQLETGVGRQRIQVDANAYGAQEARAAGAVADGLKNVANAAEHADDELNETNARELDVELSRRTRERLYNTTDGYLSTQRGLNALNSRAQVEADLDSIANDVATRARNPRAAALFRNVAQQRLASNLGTIATHAAQESVNYQNATSESRIEEELDNAVAAYGDPAQVSAHMDTITGELQTIGRRAGWSDETLNNRIHRAQSDVMSRVIVQLAGTDPQAAQDMYASVLPNLSAQDAAQLRTTMRAAERQAQDDIIDNAWTYVAQGQRVPPAVWNRVPGRARIDIQNELRRRADGGDTSGDRSYYNQLVADSWDNRNAFAQRDLRSERGRLGDANYARLRALQDAIRNGDTDRPSGVSSSTLNSALGLATSQLRAAGYDNLNASGTLGADASDRDIERYNDFRGDLIGLMDRFAEENNRQPSPQEQSEIINTLLAGRPIYRDSTFAGIRTGRQQLTVGDTYTPYSEIPRADRERIEARLRQAGRYSRGNVERYYEQEVLNAFRGNR